MVVAGALVLAGAVGLYLRERRLDAKRRSDQQHFLRIHDQRVEERLTEAERQERQRRLAEWDRRFEEQAGH